MKKIVAEDWDIFNEIARRRARSLVGEPSASGPSAIPATGGAPPVPPSPPSAGAPRTSSPRPNSRPGQWWGMAAVIGLLNLALLVLLASALSRGSQPGETRIAETRTTESGATESSRATESRATETVVINYTIFHEVAFRQGSVVTGWNFAHSGDPSPAREYCYFILPAKDGGQVRFDIEQRPTVGRLPLPEPLAAGLGQPGWDEAATKCHWPPSSHPVTPPVSPPSSKAPARTRAT